MSQNGNTLSNTSFPGVAARLRGAPGPANPPNFSRKLRAQCIGGSAKFRALTPWPNWEVVTPWAKKQAGGAGHNFLAKIAKLGRPGLGAKKLGAFRELSQYVTGHKM